MVAEDEAGIPRPTVAGVLLGSRLPQRWLPQAFIQAVAYRGTSLAEALDEPHYQLDAKDLDGPLDDQIAYACRFVTRNQRVEASKKPRHHQPAGPLPDSRRTRNAAPDPYGPPRRRASRPSSPAAPSCPASATSTNCSATNSASPSSPPLPEQAPTESLVRPGRLRTGIDGKRGSIETAAKQVEADLRVLGAVPQVVVLAGVIPQVEQFADRMPVTASL